MPDGEQQRTWVIGKGHLPLGEARRLALEELEAAELDLLEADAEFVEARKLHEEAKRRFERAYDRRQSKRSDVKKMQLALRFRMGMGVTGEAIEDPLAFRQPTERTN